MFFCRQVSLNDELKLDPTVSNRVVTLDTFSGVVLRPADLNAHDLELSRRIVELFLDKYEEVSVGQPVVNIFFIITGYPDPFLGLTKVGPSRTTVVRNWHISF